MVIKTIKPKVDHTSRERTTIMMTAITLHLTVWLHHQCLILLFINSFVILLYWYAKDLNQPEQEHVGNLLNKTVCPHHHTVVDSCPSLNKNFLSSLEKTTRKFELPCCFLYFYCLCVGIIVDQHCCNEYSAFKAIFVRILIEKGQQWHQFHCI